MDTIPWIQTELPRMVVITDDRDLPPSAHCCIPPSSHRCLRSTSSKSLLLSKFTQLAWLTIGPRRLPSRVFHTARSSASSFNFSTLSFILSLSSSYLCLFPSLQVTSIFPLYFPSITCFRRQSLRNMWLKEIAILRFIVCTTFLSPRTLCNSSFLTRSVHLILSIRLQHLSDLT